MTRVHDPVHSVLVLGPSGPNLSPSPSSPSPLLCSLWFCCRLLHIEFCCSCRLWWVIQEWREVIRKRQAQPEWTIFLSICDKTTWRLVLLKCIARTREIGVVLLPQRLPKTEIQFRQEASFLCTFLFIEWQQPPVQNECMIVARGNGVEEKLSTEKPADSVWMLPKLAQYSCHSLTLWGQTRWTMTLLVRLWWWSVSEQEDTFSFVLSKTGLVLALLCLNWWTSSLWGVAEGWQPTWFCFPCNAGWQGGASPFPIPYSKRQRVFVSIH